MFQSHKVIKSFYWIFADDCARCGAGSAGGGELDSAGDPGEECGSERRKRCKGRRQQAHQLCRLRRCVWPRLQICPGELKRIFTNIIAVCGCAFQNVPEN